MTGGLSIATLTFLKQKGVIQMIEVLIGIAGGVLVGASVATSWRPADRNEQRLVPEPMDVPAAGETWVFNVNGGFAAVVTAVVAGSVSYTLDGSAERRMPVGSFTTLYRRA